MQVVTISSRYVIFNNSSEYLHFGQRNARIAWQLAPKARMPFHWDDASGKSELCLRPAAGSWNWSGAFSVSPYLGVLMSNSPIAVLISDAIRSVCSMQLLSPSCFGQMLLYVASKSTTSESSS